MSRGAGGKAGKIVEGSDEGRNWSKLRESMALEGLLKL